MLFLTWPVLQPATVSVLTVYVLTDCAWLHDNCFCYSVSFCFYPGLLVESGFCFVDYFRNPLWCLVFSDFLFSALGLKIFLPLAWKFFCFWLENFHAFGLKINVSFYSCCLVCSFQGTSPDLYAGQDIYFFEPCLSGSFGIVLYRMEIKGFEPLTPCLQGRCSPNWAIPPSKYSFQDT